MKTLLFCILLPLVGFGQNYNLKEQLNKQAKSLVFIYVSGAFDGVADALQHHYRGTSHYWNPDSSWQNKWKNGVKADGPKFLGANNILVWTTDGWHLMRLGRNLFGAAGIVFNMGQKKKWWVYVLEGGVYMLVNRLGFSTTFNTLFN